MDNNNVKVSRVRKKGKNGTYISEVQEFNKPVDYEEAFKKYYPEQK